MTEPSPASCRAAILILLHGLSEEQRQNAALFLLRDIDEMYVSGGRPAPSWIGELRMSGDFSGVGEPGRTTGARERPCLPCRSVRALTFIRT